MFERVKIFRGNVSTWSEVVDQGVTKATVTSTERIHNFSSSNRSATGVKNKNTCWKNKERIWKI